MVGSEEADTMSEQLGTCEFSPIHADTLHYFEDQTCVNWRPEGERAATPPVAEEESIRAMPDPTITQHVSAENHPYTQQWAEQSTPVTTPPAECIFCGCVKGECSHAACSCTSCATPASPEPALRERAFIFARGIEKQYGNCCGDNIRIHADDLAEDLLVWASSVARPLQEQIHMLHEARLSAVEISAERGRELAALRKEMEAAKEKK